VSYLVTSKANKQTDKQASTEQQQQHQQKSVTRQANVAQ